MRHKRIPDARDGFIQACPSPRDLISRCITFGHGSDKIITIVHADVRCRINNFIIGWIHNKTHDAFLHHIAIGLLHIRGGYVSEQK